MRLHSIRRPSAKSRQLLEQDEDAMDKEVKDRVKDHKRKRDSDDDVLLDTRDVVIDSSRHSFLNPKSGHTKHSSDDVSKQDDGHVSVSGGHLLKLYSQGLTAATWFKPISGDERPATPEPEWTIPPNDFPEPKKNWANAYAITYQVPAENKLQRKTYDIDTAVFLQFQMDGMHKDADGKGLDLVNPEGHHILRYRGLGMVRGCKWRSKDFIQAIEKKDYRSGGSFEVWKDLVGEDKIMGIQAVNRTTLDASALQ
ncbi:hypothetical protein Tco_1525454 [Tanacetum coccineum]